MYGGKSVDYWTDHLEEPGALEACGQALRDPDARTRFVVTKGLSAVAAGSIEGARPEAAFPWLLQALRDSSEMVRYAAAIGLWSAFHSAGDAERRLDGLLDALRPDLCSAAGSEVCAHFDRLRKGAAPVLAEAGGVLVGRVVLDTADPGHERPLALAWRSEAGKLLVTQGSLGKEEETEPARAFEGRSFESAALHGRALIYRDPEGRYGESQFLLRQDGDTIFGFALVLPQKGAATTARVPGYVMAAFPAPH